MVDNLSVFRFFLAKGVYAHISLSTFKPEQNPLAQLVGVGLSKRSRKAN